MATTLTQFTQSRTKNSCGSLVRGEIFSSERTRNTRKSPNAVVRVLIHALIIGTANDDLVQRPSQSQQGYWPYSYSYFLLCLRHRQVRMPNHAPATGQPFTFTRSAAPIHLRRSVL